MSHAVRCKNNVIQTTSENENENEHDNDERRYEFVTKAG